MPTPLSQNSFEANNRALVRSVLVPGTDVKVAVRKGPVGDLLVAVAARWHREVEKLRAPDGVLDTWSYAERTIRGSATTLSNHASGTALDFRARIHPLGKVGTYSAAQRSAIRAILADCRGAVRWGGDYSGRKDEMHVEVVASEAACARVLATFTARPTPAPRPQEDPMAAMSDADAALIVEAARSVLFGKAGVRQAGELALAVDSAVRSIAALEARLARVERDLAVLTGRSTA